MGPGIVVMLADTDAGSLITAAQSGAQWGYALLPAQIGLIPIVFVVQELTVRLGVLTGQGHGELIRNHFGRGWAWLSVGTLVLACAGAIVCEMSGMVGVGLLWGVPSWLTTAAVVVFLAAVAVTGSYRSVERVAIAVGMFELVLIATMILARPDPAQIAASFIDMPLRNPSFLFLLAANIGAVVMPWMVFYQQSAVVDKGLRSEHLRDARIDTALGSIVTQFVMIGMLVTVAATLWAPTGTTLDLETVESIASALTPHLGDFSGKVLFSLGMTGASLVAAIVVSLTAAWGLGEVTGYKRSLEHGPSEAPWFYFVYGAVIAAGATITLSGVNLVDLNVAVQVMNALLLPIVLGFLFALSFFALPKPYRLRGRYAWLVGSAAGITSLFGVYAGIAGIFGGGS